MAQEGQQCGATSADVILMADRTGSIGNDLDDVRDATIGLSNLILGISGNMVGFVRFGGNNGNDAELYQGLTSNATLMQTQITLGMATHSSVGTHYQAPLDLGRTELSNGAQATCIGVFFSDGVPTNPGSDANALAAALTAATNFKNAGCRLFTVGFNVAANSQAQQNLINMASSPSDAYNASQISQLEIVFQEIFEEISCNDDFSCTDDRCDDGTCVHTPMNDRCDDRDPCTVSTCDPTHNDADGGGCVHVRQDGCISCTQEDTSVCNDGNPCTDDICSEAGICSNVADTSNSCDDGLFCNGTESCTDQGTCESTGDPCEGGEVCNNVCDEDANNCSTGANGNACDDGDANDCTQGQCVNGACNPMNNTDSCDDQVNCTTEDTCGNGECNGTPVSCPNDDGIACTVEYCDESTGQCTVDDSGCECDDSGDCDDGNACTDNICNENRECAYPPLEINTPCGDDLFCNGSEVCDGSGSCQPGSNPCEAGGECADNCNEESDHCNEPQGTTCSDDGNICTDNECNGAGECIAIDNTADCSDDDECTLNDVCSGGSCQSGADKECNDNRSCTSDSCDSSTGTCLYDNSACACNGDEDCNDNNPCTSNTCDLDSGTCQVSFLEGNSCNDEDPCTEPDQCTGEGACLGVSKSCDDENPCTTDSCDAETGGCLNTDNGTCGPNPNCPLEDADRDGFCDGDDNCPNTANPDQADSDNDNQGDVCDPTPGGEGAGSGGGQEGAGGGIVNPFCIQGSGVVGDHLSPGGNCGQGCSLNRLNSRPGRALSLMALIGFSLAGIGILRGRVYKIKTQKEES